MITLELLTEFTHEDLRYKEDINVLYYFFVSLPK